MKFDENLRALRKEKDYSQEYLAEKMNVSRQTISKWENGSAMPDLKKLTELAELFETSMDELLGTSAPSPSSSTATDNSEELELLKRRLDDFQSTFEQERKKHSKANKILCTAIIILSAGLVITSTNTSASIQNLQNSINNISSGNQVIYRDNDNEEYITDYVEHYISSVDREQPNIIELTVKYTPKSYAKGTKVTIAFSDKTSEAELIGNSFVAKAQLDVTKASDMSISVDDGKSITTEPLYMDWEFEYGAFDETLVLYDKNVLNQNSNVTSNITFDSEQLISRKNRDGMPKMIEAYLEAQNENGKTVYSQKLDLKQNEDYTTVSIKGMDFVASGNVKNVIVRLVDEFGTTYIVRCDNEFPLEDESEPTAEAYYYNRISIKFKNGKEVLPYEKR